MPTPHKHAALIKQWADDPSQDVWCWDGYQWLLALEANSPRWIESVPYAVGPKPTQPPRLMCTLAGVDFPAPVTDANKLVEGCEYFVANPAFEGGYWVLFWRQDCVDHPRFLEAGLIHYDKEDAKQHSKALLAANKQAIEGAQ
jgi:hypothetical protein